MTKKRVLSLVLTLAMVIACLPGVLAASPATLGAADINALAVGEHIYPDGLTITSLPWSTSPTDASKVTKVQNGLLTLTENGVEKIVAAGTYSGSVVLTVTKPLVEGSMTSTSRGDAYNPEAYRTGLYIDATGIVAEKSAASAVDMTKVNAAARTISGLTIESGSATAQNGSPQFSALVINGADTDNAESNQALEWTLKDSTINLYSSADGNPYSTNDFVGLGSAVQVNNGGKLTMENVDIITSGVTRPAILSNAGSYLFKNSSLRVLGGELFAEYENSADPNRMMGPPWVLGISGNARGTNLLGNNTVNIFLDSEMTATDWGVLSTDAGGDGTVAVVNSDMTMTGDTGYGIYAIGAATEYFYGADIDVATYAVILANGPNNVVFDKFTKGKNYSFLNKNGVGFSSVSSQSASRNSSVDSQFGFMAHSGENTVSIANTDLTTQNALFLHKSGSLSVNVDSTANITVTDGVLVQVMDNDDSLVGVRFDEVKDQYGTYNFPVFNTGYAEDAGFPASAYTAAGDDGAGAPGGAPAPEAMEGGGEIGGEILANDTAGVFTGIFTGQTLTGDMFNASGYQQDAKNMDITLDNTKLTGRVSKSSSAHTWMTWVDDANANAQGGYYEYMAATAENKAKIAELGGSCQEITVDGVTYLQATSFTLNEYYNLGHVVNQASSLPAGEVNLTLKNSAVWTVTGTSYLTSLTLSSGTSIVGADGQSVTMYVNGTETAIKAGATYTGEIILTVGDEWYAAAVSNLYSKGILTGSDGVNLDPDGQLTREMFVTMLARLAALSGEKTTGYTQSFTDVPGGQWYSDAIAWGTAKSIVKGTSSTTFGLGEFVTREQMAAFLVRYADVMGLSLSGAAKTFADQSAVSPWAVEAVSRATAAGLLNGSDGYLNPGKTATRAEAAQMLANFIG